MKYKRLYHRCSCLKGNCHKFNAKLCDFYYNDFDESRELVFRPFDDGGEAMNEEEAAGGWTSGVTPPTAGATRTPEPTGLPSPGAWEDVGQRDYLEAPNNMWGWKCFGAYSGTGFMFRINEEFKLYREEDS